MERHVLPNGSTIEGRTKFIPNYGISNGMSSTTVQTDKTDSEGSNVLARDVHHFYGDASFLDGFGLPNFYPPPLESREYETDRIALESGPTAVAQRAVNTWAQRPCGANENNCSWIGSPPAIQHDPNICQTNVTLQEASPNQTSGQVMLYDQYNNSTDLYEYDYGSAPAQTVQSTTCPTSFTGYSRHTSATFLTSGYDVANTGNPSASIHIRNLPTNQTISDGNGTANKTDYFYDQYGSQPLQDDSGIVGHLAAFNTTNTTRGNATSVRKWVNSSTHIDFTSQFDIAGNVVTSYDGNSKPTTITYASPTFAFPTQVCKAVNGSNRCFSQSFDLGSGKLTRRTDLNNVPTTFQYLDALDRPTIVVRASATTFQSQTLFGYTNSNTVITTTSDNLHFTDTDPIVTQKILDGLGREIESRQNDTSTCTNCYISVQRTYDALGRPYQVSNPFRASQSESLVYTTTLYDSLSRAKTVTTPGSSATQYSYQNNQTTVTDPAGKDRRTLTNGLGQLSQVYENPPGLNMLTTYSYNGVDSLLGVNQNGQTRTFAYDFLQRLTSATNPESGTVNYTSYDGNGNLLSKTDARNVQWNATYDELNRVSTRTYVTNSTSVPATPQVSYVYDDASVPYSIGRLTKVNNGSTWQILSYDALGRPTSSSQTTNSTTYTFPAYAYSRADKLTSITYPSGRVITTNYDDAGRVSQVSSGSTQYATLTTTPASGIYAYASQGAIRQMTLGNTLVEQTCFNNRLQPTGIRLGSTANGPTDCSNPGGSDLLNLAYGFGTTNNNGNLLSQTITRPGQSWTQTYSGYDGVNRLTAASEGNAWSQTYGYDNFGNRAVLSGVVNAYATPTATSQYTNNRWMGTGAAYDGAGNQTALPSRGFTYDAENRLFASVQPNTPAISYSYDGDGRRVMKNVGGTITTYVYDAQGQLAAEYGPATDSGTSYLTADHLGSTRLLTDANGVTKRCYDYYPFGEDIAPEPEGERAASRAACILAVRTCWRINSPAKGAMPKPASIISGRGTSRGRRAGSAAQTLRRMAYPFLIRSLGINMAMLAIGL
jgi:YD repeat-containing protein